MFGTIGTNYYVGWLLNMSITESLKDLQRKEASDYYKIIYMKSGPCNFVMNDREFVLTGPCAICMNERDHITFRKVCEEGIRILWFTPQTVNSKLTIKVINNPNHKLTVTEGQDIYCLNQFMHNAQVSSKILSLHTIEATSIEHKLQMIKQLLEKQDSGYWPCGARAYMLEILFALTRQEEEEELLQIPEFKGDSRFAYDVIYYLQSCYNQKITIEKLTEQFHTNRTTLLSDFKKTTGVSVNRYLIELRLKMAIMLLRDTELSVDEISDRTGFHDISYFSKVFKRKLSCTPSEYRKINNFDPYGNRS